MNALLLSLALALALAALLSPDLLTARRVSSRTRRRDGTEEAAPRPDCPRDVPGETGWLPIYF